MGTRNPSLVTSLVSRDCSDGPIAPILAIASVFLQPCQRDRDADFVLRPQDISSESDSDSDNEAGVRTGRRREAKDYRRHAKRARRPPSRSPATSTDAAFPVAAPSTSADPAVTTPAAVPAVTTPAAGPSADPQATNSDDPDDPPAATPGATRGRRRRRDCAGRDDEDLLVKFNHATMTSRQGYVWKTRPQVVAATRTAARNIIGPFTPGPTQEAAQAKTLQECFCLFINDELVAQVVQWTNQKIDEIAAKFTRKTATIQRTTATEIRALLGV
ncbi:hypothetical protein GWK47_009591 [Chionoecetes opilio]|uniref:Uncharacterized protein n=1 Tax=Chionoecetes opilio TaxID=41210 RepID=A0A8J4XXL5_CHIOP|nr:hypothetical protein GWK47_009591 [Chionoecetes opilio]